MDHYRDDFLRCHSIPIVSNGCANEPVKDQIGKGLAKIFCDLAKVIVLGTDPLHFTNERENTKGSYAEAQRKCHQME